MSDYLFDYLLITSKKEVPKNLVKSRLSSTIYMEIARLELVTYTLRTYRSPS